MKVKEILTDDLMARLSVAYAEQSKGREADYRALKLVCMAVAEIAATACGVVPEVSLVNDDGSWGP